MNIHAELKTERGVATYLGDFGLFSVFIHVDKPPENEITAINSFDTEVNILLSSIDSKECFLGSIPLDCIVDCAIEDGFITEDGSVALSNDDCSDIDDKSWSLLSLKYRLVPTKFVMPKQRPSMWGRALESMKP